MDGGSSNGLHGFTQSLDREVALADQEPVESGKGGLAGADCPKVHVLDPVRFRRRERIE